MAEYAPAPGSAGSVEPAAENETSAETATPGELAVLTSSFVVAAAQAMPPEEAAPAPEAANPEGHMAEASSEVAAVFEAESTQIEQLETAAPTVASEAESTDCSTVEAPAAAVDPETEAAVAAQQTAQQEASASEHEAERNAALAEAGDAFWAVVPSVEAATGSFNAQPKAVSEAIQSPLDEAADLAADEASALVVAAELPAVPSAEELTESVDQLVSPYDCWGEECEPEGVALASAGQNAAAASAQDTDSEASEPELSGFEPVTLWEPVLAEPLEQAGAFALELVELEASLLFPAALTDSEPGLHPLAELELVAMEELEAEASGPAAGTPAPSSLASPRYSMYGIRIEQPKRHAPLLSVGLDDTPIDRLPDVPFKVKSDVPRASRDGDEDYVYPPPAKTAAADAATAKPLRKPKPAEETLFPGKHEAPKPSATVNPPQSFTRLGRLGRWFGGISSGKRK